MRVLPILAAISFSAAALAQSAPPKVGNKPLVHEDTASLLDQQSEAPMEHFCLRP